MLVKGATGVYKFCSYETDIRENISFIETPVPSSGIGFLWSNIFMANSTIQWLLQVIYMGNTNPR